MITDLIELLKTYHYLLPPSSLTMSLLQDVLRSNTEDIDNGLKNIRLNNKRRTSYEEKDKDKDDSDDSELVNVVCASNVRYHQEL